MRASSAARTLMYCIFYVPANKAEISGSVNRIGRRYTTPSKHPVGTDQIMAFGILTEGSCTSSAMVATINIMREMK